MLITPYGERLIDLMVTDEQASELESQACLLPSLQISDRSVCDLTLLATGGFSPLDRFVTKADYERILGDMRLSDGHVFPVPITLPVDEATRPKLDTEIALRNARNELLAVMTVEEIYEWNREEAAQKVLGTKDPKHPLVAEMQRWGKLNVSGSLRVLRLPRFYDFPDLRLTPAATRSKLAALGRANVVAFQTRNPLHRAHEEMIKLAMTQVEGTLLLHPVVGITQPGDIDHYTRVRTYRLLAQRYYDPKRVLLALLPLAMRMAGPREAVWHALIRRNYGANYLIVGRDHASPGSDSQGQPFYGPYEAQELLARLAAQIGVQMIPFKNFAY
ncbi:MAG TPA: sulfate adenylyltransferase, partial [Pyrinomonadaceae bacterium]|nr:sulfate adenylyltransferase [Pyrinomonadaceae bacterium]